MLLATLQQPPPLQLLLAHICSSSIGLAQQPLLGRVAGQSPATDVESCAMWQPYFHALPWKMMLPLFCSDESGKVREPAHVAESGKVATLVPAGH